MLECVYVSFIQESILTLPSAYNREYKLNKFKIYIYCELWLYVAVFM